MEIQQIQFAPSVMQKINSKKQGLGLQQRASRHRLNQILAPSLESLR
jgi:hypothetical protein